MQIRRGEAGDEEALARIRRCAILALAVPAMSTDGTILLGLAKQYEGEVKVVFDGQKGRVTDVLVVNGRQAELAALATAIRAIPEGCTQVVL